MECYIQNVEILKPPAKNILSSKVILQIRREIKVFPEKQELREFIATRPTLQEMLERDLLPETKRQKAHKTLSKVTNR